MRTASKPRAQYSAEWRAGTRVRVQPKSEEAIVIGQRRQRLCVTFPTSGATFWVNANRCEIVEGE